MKPSLHLCLTPLLLFSLSPSGLGENLLISSNADSGQGTLRAAITAANSNGESDTLTFDESLRNATIVLTARELEISSEVTITGFSDASLTISGSNSQRIFILTEDAEVAFRNLTLINGRTDGRGAGIFNAGRLTVDGCTFRGHSAAIGSGISNFEGRITVRDSLFDDNFATDDGAGLDSFGTSAEEPGLIERCTFTQNRVDRNGAAFSSFGPFLITASSFSNNTALMNGGSIFNGNDLTLNGCTFFENEARDNGGAIENRGAPFRLANCTFTENNATQGGAIRSRFDLACLNCTFSENEASEAPGTLLFVDSGNFRLINSIISGGSSPQVETRDSTAVFLFGQNIASGSSFRTLSNLSNPQNIQNETDARLGPLADNEGFVRTHALAMDSPAIDSGDNNETQFFLSTPLLTDARGIPRFLRTLASSDTAHIDLGAVESIPPVTLSVRVEAAPVLEVSGVAGNRYQLSATSQLAVAPFSSIATFTLDPEGRFSLTDNSLPLAESRFFRLEIINSNEESSPEAP